jgi:hypothetical protein
MEHIDDAFKLEVLESAEGKWNGETGRCQWKT